MFQLVGAIAISKIISIAIQTPSIIVIKFKIQLQAQTQIGKHRLELSYRPFHKLNPYKGH
jgi:hypothetical protein